MHPVEGIMRNAYEAMRLGDLAAAEDHCRKFIAVASDQALPWAMLSEIAFSRKDWDGALANAERAAGLDPKLLLARVMHAKCLLRCGEYSAALAAAEAGVRIEMAPAEALDGLGAVFGMLGRHRQALSLFRRAIAVGGAVPQFLFNLAATERILGELDAAEAHCDAAIAVNRHFDLAYYLRSDLRIQTASRNHVAEMEALVANGGRGWPGEAILRFALGKEYEDLGDDQRAFEHIAAGAALQRRQMSYSVSTDIAVIERTMRTQTRQWLASAPPGHDSGAPIFVMGLPRSGTTVVERILASHSAVGSIGEVGVFSVTFARALTEAQRRAAANKAALSAPALDLSTLGRRYVQSAKCFPVPDKAHFVDKTLQNYLYCGLIHAALPKAKIIFVHRRPMDNCYALYKTHFDGTFRFSYDLNELAEYYLAFRRLARHWQAVLPSQIFQEVQYEDIVRDQRGASRRLLEFLGLPWEEEVLRFHESLAPSATASAVQVRRPLYGSSVGRWRRHRHGLQPLYERLRAELPANELEQAEE